MNGYIPLEFKFQNDMQIEGYGSVFNLVDEGGDIIESGAFDESLAQGRRIKMLWQHDPTEPIGIWDEVKPDAKGLKVRGHLLPELSKAKEVHAMLKNGVIDGLSIGYRTVDSVRQGPNRIIKKADLWEISVVTFPMNSAATVTSVKNLSTRDIEHVLREVGMPISFAKLVASYGYEEALAKVKADQREVDQMKTLVAELKKLKEMLNG